MIKKESVPVSVPASHVHTPRTDAQMMAVDIRKGGVATGQLVLRFCSDLTCKAVFWEETTYNTVVSPKTGPLILRGNYVLGSALTVTIVPGVGALEMKRLK